MEQQRVRRPIETTVALMSTWHGRLLGWFEPCLIALGVRPRFTELPPPSIALGTNDSFLAATTMHDFGITDTLYPVYAEAAGSTSLKKLIAPLYSYQGYSLLIAREFAARTLEAPGLRERFCSARDFLGPEQDELRVGFDWIGRLIAKARIGVVRYSMSELYLRHIATRCTLDFAELTIASDLRESEAQLRQRLLEGELDILINTEPPDITEGDFLFCGHCGFQATHYLFGESRHNSEIAQALVTAWQAGYHHLLETYRDAVGNEGHQVDAKAAQLVGLRAITLPGTDPTDPKWLSLTASRRLATWMGYSVNWRQIPTAIPREQQAAWAAMTAEIPEKLLRKW